MLMGFTLNQSKVRKCCPDKLYLSDSQAFTSKRNRNYRNGIHISEGAYISGKMKFIKDIAAILLIIGGSVVLMCDHNTKYPELKSAGTKSAGTTETTNDNGPHKNEHAKDESTTGHLRGR